MGLYGPPMGQTNSVMYSSPDNEANVIRDIGPGAARTSITSTPSTSWYQLTDVLLSYWLIQMLWVEEHWWSRVTELVSVSDQTH